MRKLLSICIGFFIILSLTISVTNAQSNNNQASSVNQAGDEARLNLALQDLQKKRFFNACANFQKIAFLEPYLKKNEQAQYLNRICPVVMQDAQAMKQSYQNLLTDQNISARSTSNGKSSACIELTKLKEKYAYLVTDFPQIANLAEGACTSLEKQMESIYLLGQTCPRYDDHLQQCRFAGSINDCMRIGFGDNHKAVAKSCQELRAQVNRYLDSAASDAKPEPTQPTQPTQLPKLPINQEGQITLRRFFDWLSPSAPGVFKPYKGLADNSNKYLTSWEFSNLQVRLNVENDVVTSFSLRLIRNENTTHLLTLFKQTFEVLEQKCSQPDRPMQYMMHIMSPSGVRFDVLYTKRVDFEQLDFQPVDRSSIAEIEKWTTQCR